MPRTWEYENLVLNPNDKGNYFFIAEAEKWDAEGWETFSVHYSNGQMILFMRRPYVDPRSIEETPEEKI